MEKKKMTTERKKKNKKNTKRGRRRKKNKREQHNNNNSNNNNNTDAHFPTHPSAHQRQREPVDVAVGDVPQVRHHGRRTSLHVFQHRPVRLVEALGP